MSAIFTITYRVITSPSFFVIASPSLPVILSEAKNLTVLRVNSARQSISPTQIASAGFTSLATTERKYRSDTERGHPFDACE
jgi:hypothetical protein